MSNKVLAIILAVLVGMFLLSRIFGGNKSRSFDPHIVNVNSADITELIITVPGEESAIVQKNQDQWQVSNGSKNYNANETVINSIIREVSSIEADKVISRSIDNAAKYGTDEETATKIMVKSDDETLAEVLVGRFSFNQQTRQPISYLRLADQDETYLIGSFIATSLNKDFNGLRDKSLISLNPAVINAISYQNQGDIITLDLGLDNNWITNDEVLIDSASISNFLNTMTDKNGVEFSDGASTLSIEETLTFHHQDGSAIKIFASIVQEDSYVIYSDQFPENIFTSNATSLYQQIFGKYKEMIAKP